MTVREKLWKHAESESFDLIVVGGGIIGCGAARDAALRGLKVALIEAVDLASGTSSRSSKLVHGGLRYLEQLQFGLVFESVSERQVLQQIAPHLVHPLGFLFPIYDHSPVSLSKLRLGLMVYDGMSLFRSPKVHRYLNRRKMIDQTPVLSEDALQGGPLYYDCMTDDARLTLETALDAEKAGATVVTHARVQRFLRDDGGRITGVRVADNLGPSEAERVIDVRGAAVLNATGPWTDSVRGSEGPPLLRTTKGVHIVVQSSRLPLEHTVVVLHPDDGRVMFVIPWGTETYIGTTDTDYDGDPRDVAADGEDIRYLLEAVNAYFPTVDVVPDDVICTWAGLRPLIRQEGMDESAVSREHKILVDDDGLITIAGGKLTTYRRMGDEVIDTVVGEMKKAGHAPAELRVIHTDREALLGAVGWPEGDALPQLTALIDEACDGRLDDDVIAHMASRYGMRAVELARYTIADQARMERLVPGRPELMALVDWAVEFELACTVSDVMTRRTQLYFRDIDQGLGVLDRVGARMQHLLGWTDEERAFFSEEYTEEVALSRRWQGEHADAVVAHAAAQAATLRPLEAAPPAAEAG